MPYNCPTDPLFKKSNILKLKSFYEYEVALFMYKFDRQLLPSSFSNMFRYQRETNTTHTTRNLNLLIAPKPNSEFVNVLPAFYFPKIWNKYTSLLNDANTLYQAKRTIKSYLTNNNSPNWMFKIKHIAAHY